MSDQVSKVDDAMRYILGALTDDEIAACAGPDGMRPQSWLALADGIVRQIQALRKTRRSELAEKALMALLPTLEGGLIADGTRLAVDYADALLAALETDRVTVDTPDRDP